LCRRFPRHGASRTGTACRTPTTRGGWCTARTSPWPRASGTRGTRCRRSGSAGRRECRPPGDTRAPPRSPPGRRATRPRRRRRPRGVVGEHPFDAALGKLVQPLPVVGHALVGEVLHPRKPDLLHPVASSPRSPGGCCDRRCRPRRPPMAPRGVVRTYAIFPRAMFRSVPEKVCRPSVTYSTGPPAAATGPPGPSRRWTTPRGDHGHPGTRSATRWSRPSPPGPGRVCSRSAGSRPG
jgi:hypothetical protein